MFLFSIFTAGIIINSTFFNFSNLKLNLQVTCGVCCTKGLWDSVETLLPYQSAKLLQIIFLYSKSGDFTVTLKVYL